MSDKDRQRGVREKGKVMIVCQENVKIWYALIAFFWAILMPWRSARKANADFLFLPGREGVDLAEDPDKVADSGERDRLSKIDQGGGARVSRDGW